MNGILLIDKPAGMTSHDVVNRIRRIYHTRKVGHAGTLDPMATGVLVIGIGKATKALQFLSADEKAYQCTLKLGEATTTYDAEGDVTEAVPFTGYEHLEDVMAGFLGTSLQMPPLYSAIKVDGKKLYEYAREHQDVKVKPREITIHQLDIIAAEGPFITFYVRCSKGTYVRSLCVDIARQLGYPGHMTALRRMSSGSFDISACHALEDVDETLQPISLDDVFMSYDRLVIDDEKIAMTGRKIKSDCDHNVAIYSQEGHVLAIYGPDGQGYLKSLRGLF